MMSVCRHTVHVFLQNTMVTFFNNTAVEAGAAIYASDLSRCTFTSRECPAKNSSQLNPFERSIFQEEPPFCFERLEVEYGIVQLLTISPIMVQ